MLLVLTSAFPVLGASAPIGFQGVAERDVMVWLSGTDVRGADFPFCWPASALAGLHLEHLSL